MAAPDFQQPATVSSVALDEETRGSGQEMDPFYADYQLDPSIGPDQARKIRGLMQVYDENVQWLILADRLEESEPGHFELAKRQDDDLEEFRKVEETMLDFRVMAGDIVEPAVSGYDKARREKAQVPFDISSAVRRIDERTRRQGEGTR